MEAGLLAPVHSGIRCTDLGGGRGRGYIAQECLPACTLLLRERPRDAAGRDVASAQKALALRIVGDAGMAELCAPEDVDPGPAPEGVSARDWSRARSQVKHNAFGRRAKAGGWRLFAFEHPR
mmetsp:Transcript_68972/g.218129  ORF Transcript_68972/g.218129 Transcript_68972/m.218129 type:complete len:122 (-) Transcript_68972:181-546(-)